MANPLTRACGRLIAAIRELRAQRWSRMAVAVRIQSSPVRVRKGLWRGDGRLHWRGASDMRRARQLFYAIYTAPPIGGGEQSWWRRRLGSAIDLMLDMSSRQWLGDADRGPTAVFVSRDGALKYFDFDARAVMTLMSADALERMTCAQGCPIFGHFGTPSHERHETSDVAHPCPASLCITRQRMLMGPCLGMLSPHAQIEAVRSICETYSRYVKAESGPPNAGLVARCLGEVADCLEPSQRARLLSHEPALMEFAESARTVQSHLDFNVANFMADSGRWWILDIADAGLPLPATYDVNNILLNEVHQCRSTHLLDAALKSPVEMRYHSVLEATVGKSTLRDFRVSLLLNAVLRESQHVASALRVPWQPSHIPGRWRLLEQSIAGWPLEDG